MGRKHPVHIRPATTEDIPAMMQLERAATGAAHWQERDYAAIFAPGAPRRAALLGVQEEAVTGLLVVRREGPEWEIENIAVALTARRQGLAKALLAELLEQAHRGGAAEITLEVRESNQPARHLYELFGFKAYGWRQGYYRNPVEDAITYRRDLRVATPESG
jgi:ribosomal-protein-alanine N-acetyltransferase